MYALAVLIPLGKTDDVRRFMADLLGARKAEYEDLARRSDVSEGHSWLQHDEAGDFLVVASDSDQTKYRQILANPATNFDRWMRRRSSASSAATSGSRPVRLTNPSAACATKHIELNRAGVGSPAGCA